MEEIKCFEELIVSQDDFGKLSPADLAESYLTERKLIEPEKKIHLWHECFYIFSNSHYVAVPIEEVKSDVVRWMQSKADFRHKTKTDLVNNVMLNLKSITHLSSTIGLAHSLVEI